MHSDELATTCHCSQANECELRWKWRKCGDFGLYNSIVIQSQIGTLKRYKRPIHYRRLTDWKPSPFRSENVEDHRRRMLIVTSQSLWYHDHIYLWHHSNAVNESTATEWLNNGEKRYKDLKQCNSFNLKKYVKEDCHSCVSINGTMMSFACWLLLGDNTSLSKKKHGPQTSPQCTGYSLHPYFMCMWTNSDHPLGGHIKYRYHINILPYH